MVNIGLFARLIPLQSLLPQDQAHLAKQSSLLQFQPGQLVFKAGELARTQAYLVSGELELQAGGTSRLLRGDSDEARHPLAPGSRRSATALAIKPSQVLFVDRDLLDVLLTWSQTGGVELKSLGDDEAEEEAQDWMTALLQSKAFLRIPPANIAQLFTAMEPVTVSAGDVVLKQGSPGDYYYIITEGKVQVVLEDPSGLHEEELATLGVGKGFGEEALLSGEPRNATVRALTKTHLMRLSGAAFNKLLKAPLLVEVNSADKPPHAVWLDVRLPDEFAHGHLPNAKNLPLVKLRALAATLDPALEYWVYCDTGRRSASAVYLLCERGFNAKLVRGGVPAAQLTEAGGVARAA